MGQVICDYCGGSGRDAVTPTQLRCWKCHAMGSYWVQDPVKVDFPDAYPAPSGGSSSPRHRRQYQMLPWMQGLLDSIPGWSNFLFAFIGSGVGIVLAQETESVSHGLMAMFALFGFFAGLGFLRLTVVLVDLAAQFAIMLVKTAIVIILFGGIVYALIKWIEVP